MSTLTQAIFIYFFILTALKTFSAVISGAELGLSTPFTSHAASVLLFLDNEFV